MSFLRFSLGRLNKRIHANLSANGNHADQVPRRFYRRIFPTSLTNVRGSFDEVAPSPANRCPLPDTRNESEIRISANRAIKREKKKSHPRAFAFFNLQVAKFTPHACVRTGACMYLGVPTIEVSQASNCRCQTGACGSRVIRFYFERGIQSFTARNPNFE